MTDEKLIEQIARLRLNGVFGQGSVKEAAEAANKLEEDMPNLDATALIGEDFHELTDHQLLTIIAAEGREALLLTPFDAHWSTHRYRVVKADAILTARRRGKG
jgi:hypothetical protein